MGGFGQIPVLACWLGMGRLACRETSIAWGLLFASVQLFSVPTLIGGVVGSIIPGEEPLPPVLPEDMQIPPPETDERGCAKSCVFGGIS